MSTMLKESDKKEYEKIIPWKNKAFIGYHKWGGGAVETVIFIDNVDFSREWPLGDKLWDHETITVIIKSYLVRSGLVSSQNPVSVMVPESGTGAVKICIVWNDHFGRYSEFSDIYCIHFTMNALTRMIESDLFSPVEEKLGVCGYRFQPFQIPYLVRDLEIEDKINIEHSGRPGF